MKTKFVKESLNESLNESLSRKGLKGKGHINVPQDGLERKLAIVVNHCYHLLDEIEKYPLSKKEDKIKEDIAKTLLYYLGEYEIPEEDYDNKEYFKILKK